MQDFPVSAAIPEEQKGSGMSGQFAKKGRVRVMSPMSADTIQVSKATESQEKSRSVLPTLWMRGATAWSPDVLCARLARHPGR